MKRLIIILVLCAANFIYAETINKLAVKNLKGNSLGAQLNHDSSLSPEQHKEIMLKLEKYKKHREESLKYLEQLEKDDF